MRRQCEQEPQTLAKSVVLPALFSPLPAHRARDRAAASGCDWRVMVDARLNPVRPFLGSNALGNAQVASGSVAAMRNARTARDKLF
jgi:hypothetical protein